MKSSKKSVYVLLVFSVISVSSCDFGPNIRGLMCMHTIAVSLQLPLGVVVKLHCLGAQPHDHT